MDTPAPSSPRLGDNAKSLPRSSPPPPEKISYSGENFPKDETPIPPRPSLGQRLRSGLDWIVPVAAHAESDSDETRPTHRGGVLTARERLSFTLAHAKAEKVKSQLKARVTGYALNIAIGLQVLLSALITGLSALIVGRRSQVMTSILGGTGTLIASYLAKARGSNEPDLSISRTKDLDKFIRELEVFIIDHGDESGLVHDKKMEEYRLTFEQLLGNGPSDKKSSPA